MSDLCGYNKKGCCLPSTADKHPVGAFAPIWDGNRDVHTQFASADKRSALILFNEFNIRINCCFGRNHRSVSSFWAVYCQNDIL